ncbi:MAG: C69 family dipeptidase [Promethearchaeota archaeon]|jgi:secernin
MCDNYVCLSEFTKDKSVIFGKNSDRNPSEAQLITYKARMKYPKGDYVKCTHISIPQVSETAAVILSQPYFMFGAEMGANEYGVSIGNEAIMTKEPLNDEGLLGMDILRLGLERGKSAKEALNIIINLLEVYGQGGEHSLTGYNHHNSFIIADPQEAFLLETAGEWWIVEIIKYFRSISNDISIRGKGDIRRKGIIEHAIEKGYCKDDDDFDFAITFSSPQNLLCSSTQQLNEYKKQISPALMMNLLRDHEGNICRHKRIDMTAGSQVSHLRKSKSIHWFTGSLLTCLSIYKPYTFPLKSQKVLEAKPYSAINPDWFWKRHTDFLKPFMRNPKKENSERDLYTKELRSIENDLIRKVDSILSQEDKLSEDEFVEEISQINDQAWQKSEEMII